MTMTVPGPTCTIETAPRTFEELAMQGRYRLRDLALMLGLGQTTEARSALAVCKTEDLANSVCRALAEWDTAHPATAAAPEQAPQQMQLPVAQQQPAPVIAPAPAPGEIKRTPKRGRPAGSKNKPMDDDPASVVLPPEGLDSLTAQVRCLSQQINDLQQTQGAQIASINKCLSDIPAKLESILEWVLVATGLNVMLVQKEMGISIPDIISGVKADMEEITQLLGKANQGGK